jgi:hypothetical protein
MTTLTLHASILGCGLFFGFRVPLLLLLLCISIRPQSSLQFFDLFLRSRGQYRIIRVVLVVLVYKLILEILSLRVCRHRSSRIVGSRLKD